MHALKLPKVMAPQPAELIQLPPAGLELDLAGEPSFIAAGAITDDGQATAVMPPMVGCKLMRDTHYNLFDCFVHHCPDSVSEFI
jgi:hypothetical protein